MKRFTVRYESGLGRAQDWSGSMDDSEAETFLQNASIAITNGEHLTLPLPGGKGRMIVPVHRIYLVLMEEEEGDEIPQTQVDPMGRAVHRETGPSS